MGAGGGAAVALFANTADYIATTKRVEALSKISAKRHAELVAENNRQFVRSAQDIRIRTTEERAQISAEVEGIVSALLNTSGSVTSAAGAGNVAGVSVGDVRGDIERQAADRRAGLSILQRFRERAADRRIDAARIQTNLQNISSLPQPLVKPDFLSAIFAGAASSVSAYNAGTTTTNKSADSTVKEE